MTQDLSVLIIIIIIVFACIFLNNYFLKTGFISNLLKPLNPGKAEIQLSEKLLGAFIFGVIPYIFLVVLPGRDPAEFGITTGKMPQYRLSVFLVSVLILLVSYIFSGKEIFRNNLLQNTIIDEVNLKNILLTSAGWIIYLFGYELLFRGILWFSCFRVIGFFPALLVNLALYALAHYKMSGATILGSVPAGVFFCGITVLMGSFLPAFILHSIMAAGFTIFSFYHISSERIKTDPE